MLAPVPQRISKLVYLTCMYKLNFSLHANCFPSPYRTSYMPWKIRFVWENLSKCTLLYLNIYSLETILRGYHILIPVANHSRRADVFHKSGNSVSVPVYSHKPLSSNFNEPIKSCDAAALPFSPQKERGISRLCGVNSGSACDRQILP